MLTDQDLQALNEFCEKYPTWWYKLGYCSLTRDFDCAPQAHSPEMEISKHANDIWDNGFSCDHTGSFSDAIRQVMEDIKEALNE